MQKTNNKVVIEYYKNNQPWYNAFWSDNALHYGLWEEGTRNLKEAIQNTNKSVSELLEIKKSDVVLDAGCGVGGTSFYIAEKYGANVHGITLSEVQLKQASSRARHSHIKNNPHFYRRDYLKTGFKGSYFTKIFGIESFSHCSNHQALLDEMYRILKPGGKMAIVDGFSAKNNLSDDEARLFENLISGFAIPMPVSIARYKGMLKKAGFKKIRFHGKFQNILKSGKIIGRRTMAVCPFTFLLSNLGIVPSNVHGTVLAGIAQKRLLDRRLATYGIFTAEK